MHMLALLLFIFSLLNTILQLLLGSAAIRRAANPYILYVGSLHSKCLTDHAINACSR